MTALSTDEDATQGLALAERRALAPCPLRIEPATRERLQRGLDEHVLACLHYGTDAPPVADPRLVPIALDPVGQGFAAELWLSNEPVSTGVTDGIHHTANSEVLFGWLHLSEADIANMERSVLRAYVRADQLIRALGYPNWLRAWNYLARITDGAGDAERYRQFSLGRHHAVALRPGFEQTLPAATAIGTHGEGLTLCFMAGRTPALQVENPRQVSAFRYPREYGPRSPSFSRAMLKHWRDCSLLFVSGTASVVGHATLHPGDSERQLLETLANVDALLTHAARLHLGGSSSLGFTPEGVKLYVRTEQSLAEVEHIVQQRLRPHAPVAILKGDICRTDLAVEVESVFRWRADQDSRGRA